MRLNVSTIMKRLLFLLFVAVSSQSLFSQEITFEATAPQVVEVGEQFRLMFSVNAKPSSFQQPDIKGFYVIAGPSVSFSSSVEIVNGQVS